MDYDYAPALPLILTDWSKRHILSSPLLIQEAHQSSSFLRP